MMPVIQNNEIPLLLINNPIPQNYWEALGIYHPYTDFPYLQLEDINRYFPIDYPALFQALLPYLGIHDLFKLRMVSKVILISIMASDATIAPWDSKQFVINAMEHNCSNCVEHHVERGHKPLLPKLLLSGLKYQRFKSLELIQELIPHMGMTGDSMWEYPEAGCTLEGTTDVKTIFVHQCVMQSITDNDTTTKALLEYITKNFKIKHNGTLKIICNFHTKTIMENIISKLELSPHSSVIITCGELMLPILCEYNMVDALGHVDMRSIDYITFIRMIRNGIDRYDPEIIRVLLINLFGIYIISRDDTDMIYEWILKVENENCIKQILLSGNLLEITNIAIKIRLIPKIYEYNLSQYALFLDSSKELNILSINLAFQHNEGKLFTSKLTNEEIFDFVGKTNNRALNEDLILSVQFYSRQSIRDEIINPVIDWVIAFGDLNVIINHLLKINSISDSTKVKLIPKAYEHHALLYVDFLNTTKELNILSIQQAIKYPTSRFFADKLTSSEIIKYIVRTNGIVRKTLIGYLMLKNEQYAYDKADYTPPSREILYKVTQNVLPKHYKYDDDANNWEDNKVECYYQVHISRKVLSLSHVEILLKVEPQCFHKIVEKMSELCIYWRNEKMREHIRLIANHPQFSEVLPSNVFRMLPHCIENDDVIDSIIANHQFFRQFENQ